LSLRPPSGDTPPTSAKLPGGGTLDLSALAQEICRRYRTEFPDEVERYGDTGHAWCVHDNQYLLEWGAMAVTDVLDMHAEVAWLASVLEARGFPVERLARDLEIGADVVLTEVGGPGVLIAEVLVDAAAMVRSRATFPI
jgi:hypothetical protein